MHDTTRQSHKQKLIKALEANWRTEMEGAATYHTLADLEADPRHTAVLHQLTEVEARHAERWAGRIAYGNWAAPLRRTANTHPSAS